MNNTLQNSSNLTRRAFLKHASANAAMLALSPAVLRAAHGANDRLSIGMIGSGDRASALRREILSLAKKQNVAITAVCDVWRKNREGAVATIQKECGNPPRLFTHYEELLALKDIDAVTIATPDFSHGPILVAALKAGKDVYIEKPMSIDLEYANQALDLARSNDRVVQAGTQHRSEGTYLGAAKFLQTGALGKISRISVAMNFNQARWLRAVDDCVAADVDWDAFLLHREQRPFDAKLLRRWQLYRATSNGMAGLWMTHYADLVHLLTGAKYPATAVALGGTFVWKDGREHTDTFHAIVEYPEEFLFDWSMGLANSGGTHFTVHGTKGTLDLEKWQIIPEPGKDNKLEAGPVPREPGVSHMGNWLECVRTRKQPNADIQFGHQHAVTTIMSAKALESGARQKYDPAQRVIMAG
jgi:predicted dehydrogenase